MRGASVSGRIIYSTGFLAVIPAFLVMVFLHPSVSKYTLDVKSNSTYSWPDLYEDINGDSISESIYSGKGVPYYFIGIKDYKERFYDQWNLKDSLNPFISNMFFGNYDHDSEKEIYLFTHKGDSLFLNINEMFDTHGTRLDRIFITKIGFIKNEVTSFISPAGFYDVNDDGSDEIYFGISTGFMKDPRRFYYFDIVNSTLISTQFTGFIGLFPEMKDVNGDGHPEIFGMMSACGNFGKSVPFSDSSTWFMVFNDKLKFVFQPLEFPGYVNSLEIKAFKNDTFRGFVLSHMPMGMDPTLSEARIMVFSPDGIMIRYLLYKNIGLVGRVKLFVVNSGKKDKILLLTDKFIELNENLELIRKVKLPFKSQIQSYQFDLNNDGEDEFLIYSDSEERMAVYSADLKKLTELRFKAPDQNWKFCKYLSKDHQYKVHLSSGNSGFFLDLKRNRYYFIGFLVYPGIYLLFFVFIVLIKRINTLQVVQKESLNRRLVTLQLQGIKSQLDPHFTFNTLNSIASLIYLEDRHLAYDYMNKFTHLLRSLINDAEKIYRSLGEEIEFVTTYLELEKLRFGDKFNYEITIGENVSMQELVPKLVLQTFTENSIKHGFESETGGKLRITAFIKDDYLVLSIEDNGVGRAKTEGQSLSTGKGLKLTGEFYDILNQLNKKPVRHYIIDLHDETGEPSGTRVEVWVPVS